MHLFNFYAFFAFFALLTTAQSASTSYHPDVGELVRIIKTFQGEGKKIASCDISGAVLPDSDNNPDLPRPNGAELKFITIGQGTQNYTCADDDATTKPVPAGAVAILYDGSCLVDYNGKHLDLLNSISLRSPGGTLHKNLARLLGLKMLGKHYFVEEGPFFDFRFNGNTENALVVLVGKVLAPDANNVAWVRLDKVSGTGIQSIFRVHTVQGSAPDTCAGMKPSFEVPYTAQYWVYGP